jgi:hypothetical protein
VASAPLLLLLLLLLVLLQLETLPACSCDNAHQPAVQPHAWPLQV